MTDIEYRTATAADEARAAAVKADTDWQAELERLHGKNAGNVRYTPAGRLGTLAPLYAEYRRTAQVWREAVTRATDARRGRG